MESIFANFTLGERKNDLKKNCSIILKSNIFYEAKGHLTVFETVLVFCGQK